jgi:hypothetical protein
VQRNVDPTHQCSYYVALTELIKILYIKILKYMKLINVKLQYCSVISVKKSKPFQVQQLCAAVWIMHLNIYVDRMYALYCCVRITP